MIDRACSRNSPVVLSSEHIRDGMFSEGRDAV